MSDFNPNKLNEDELRLCHNLYNKKWKARNKDKTRAYNVEYYKKCKGIKNELVPKSIRVLDVLETR
jgi:hypothetical protein